MGRILYKKGERGIAASYISRKQALKKLQLSLKDFRRLCILKGIYPVEPHHKKKANKNNSSNKTYYLLKDIQFLAHEPLINKFRSFRIFVRRLKKAIGKKDQEASIRLRENQPVFNLDHIVKERYPTFIDALRDVDDAISMGFLFATFPKTKNVKTDLIQLCRRLTVEFMHFIVEAKALRKVFISIKGIYYQAEIMGQQITWIVPHNLGYARPTEVDFKIMVTFAQFYSTMLGFINYKLYHSINLVYPPKLAIECSSTKELLKGEDEYSEFVAALNLNLKSSVKDSLEEDATVDEFPEGEDSEEIQARKAELAKIQKLKNLFSQCKIFLNREVPIESLLFIIKCFGGKVSYDNTMHVGATYDEDDETITHHIIDRPLGKSFLNRKYVQPQWIYDSVNARTLLPVELYAPGEMLPPHLSPFVEEKESDYVPLEKQALMDYQTVIDERESGDDNVVKELNNKYVNAIRHLPEENESDEENDLSVDEKESDSEGKKKRKAENEISKNKDKKMKVTKGTRSDLNSEKLAQKEAAEIKRLAILAMPKKDKHLYNKIIHGQKRKNREVQKLKEKRESVKREQKMHAKTKA
ncbi:pescadillo homolog [Caerostris extrusa]|uniref:Pescadillo homolog n=1 Tax=Caerostris extrusa TaxID=172846 RepID=A0AAV4SXY5_CAEEX|nr:pescadillo homolog [Caerostris extrusa]